MKRIVLANYEEVSAAAAAVLIKQINANPGSVLGLATGSTPIGMYGNLVEAHRRGELDFSGVRTFNLDEYYPIRKNDAQSYSFFMWEHLFSHVNILEENIHLLNGECADPAAECDAYEQMLEEAGGVDIQVLGIGNEGHIAFNEADAELKLRTHLADLSASTIEANARFFSSPEEVPTQALSMGMGSIMRAKSILLLITGEQKAAAAKQLFGDVVSTRVPASFLHLHPDVTVILDQAAASLL